MQTFLKDQVVFYCRDMVLCLVVQCTKWWTITTDFGLPFSFKS